MVNKLRLSEDQRTYVVVENAKGRATKSISKDNFLKRSDGTNPGKFILYFAIFSLNFLIYYY